MIDPLTQKASHIAREGHTPRDHEFAIVDSRGRIVATGLDERAARRACLKVCRELGIPWCERWQCAPLAPLEAAPARVTATRQQQRNRAARLACGAPSRFVVVELPGESAPVIEGLPRHRKGRQWIRTTERVEVGTEWFRKVGL